MAKYWLGGYQAYTEIEPDEGWMWINNEGFFNYLNWGIGQPATIADCSYIDTTTESIPRWYGSVRAEILIDCGLIIEWK